jgi:outer membrane protein TolC
MRSKYKHTKKYYEKSYEKFYKKYRAEKYANVTLLRKNEKLANKVTQLTKEIKKLKQKILTLNVRINQYKKENKNDKNKI